MKHDCRKKLKYIFKNNLNEGSDLIMVWDASKAFIKGYLIHYNSEIKRKMEEKKQQNILNEIKRKRRNIEELPRE